MDSFTETTILPVPLMEVKSGTRTLLEVRQSKDGVHVLLAPNPLTPLEYAKVASTMHLAILHLTEE